MVLRAGFIFLEFGGGTSEPGSGTVWAACGVAGGRPGLFVPGWPCPQVATQRKSSGLPRLRSASCTCPRTALLGGVTMYV